MLILVYLLKAVICTGVLFLYYYLFLRERADHQYNRFYLLGTVVAGLILPLIAIPLPWSVQSSTIPLYFHSLETLENTPGAASGTARWSFMVQALLVVYLIISTTLFARLVLSLHAISNICRKYPAQKLNGLWLYYTTEPNTPYSFFNRIVWNRFIDLRSEKGRQIFRHECYHVRQKHSLDLIFMQVILSFLWFNPFYYLIRNELSTIHEYLADGFAVAGSDEQVYAELLLENAVSKKQNNEMVHFFFHSQLKRRINMLLTNNNSSRLSLSGKLAGYVLFMIMFCSFAFRAEISRPSSNPNSSPVNQSDTVSEPTFKGGSSEWREFLINSLRYPQLAQDNEIQGKVVVTFTVNTDGSVEGETVIADPGYGLGDEAVRIIRLSSGRWEPALKNGKAISAIKSQPFIFRLERQ